MTTARAILLLIALCWPAVVISQEPRASAFEVVSIRQSASRDAGASAPVIAGQVMPGGRWTTQNAPLSMILRTLHGVTRDQIAGGPSWLDAERFDITAIAPAGAADTDIRQMVVNLLAERFQLVTHNERRAFEVVALEMAAPDGRLGPGLRRNAACDSPANDQPPDVDTAAGFIPKCGAVSMRTIDGVRRLRITGQPLANLLVLTNANAEVGQRVFDRTGLSGRFDVQMDYVPRTLLLNPAGGHARTGVPFVTAVREQLGLSLERRRETLDVIVIDSVELPSPN